MGFCDDPVVQGPTTPQTIGRVMFIVPWTRLMSPHFKPNSSLGRKPVKATRSTSVRSRKPKPLINAFISGGVSKVGALRRFAPCRTNRIGLRSKNSCRHAWLKTTDSRPRIFAQLLFANGNWRSHDSTFIVLTSERRAAPQCGTIHFFKYVL